MPDRSHRKAGRVAGRALALAGAAALAACAAPPGSRDGVSPPPPGIAAPLDGLTGDSTRGFALLAARDPANCVLCHAVPGIAPAGNVGPPLAGVAARMSRATLRQRVVDERRIVPDTIMPAYHVVDGLTDVAPRYRGRPILDAQQVEDVVAFLGTLR